jgi:hypothetical protein
MTVVELCDRLLEIERIRLSVVLEDSDRIEDSDFSEAFTPQWLADNVQAVFEVTNRQDAREDELVGAMETNAFLASFQKSYESSRRNRVNRWAGIYSSAANKASDIGPLAVQLRNIGIKVEEEFLTNVVELT